MENQSIKDKNKKYNFKIKILKIFQKTLFIITICFLFKSSSYGAISNNFKFVIDTVGIPRYNALNEEINEEVYYTYNVFSYSSPVALVRQGSRPKMVRY